MKREFSTCPAAIDEKALYGFSWMEHVTAVPSPLAAVTSYKKNGRPNAAMQSWFSFTSDERQNFYVIFGSVNKYQHMYSSVRETGCLTVNFPSKEFFLKCMDTIEKNDYDWDEIAAVGLTAEPSSKVNAPRIKECFLNLECEYAWEKDLLPGGDIVTLCAKVVNVCMDQAYYNTWEKGRYGETGYLYNIHSPRNPETGETNETQVGVILPYAAYNV